MAITTDDTVWEGMDSNGVMTATRYITIPAGNMKQLDLAESNLIPQIGDAHPENSSWTVYSIGNIQYADIPNEYRISVKYRRTVGGISITTNNERAPWDNGVFNHRTSFGTIEVPMTELFDAETKTYFDLKNSAGQTIPAMGKFPYKIETFQCNFNTKSGKHKELAPEGTLNCNAEVLFGKIIQPYAGMIMRMESEDHTVYQNDGKTVKWKYETISYEIHRFLGFSRTWKLEFLNIGNMYIHTVEDQKVPSRIYQYTPWASADPSKNAKVKPKLGCIDDVIAARNVYQKALQDAGKDYAKDIPWEEANDIPLVYGTGEIDTAAIAGTKKYDRISGYESQGVSWSKYLPDEATK